MKRMEEKEREKADKEEKAKKRREKKQGKYFKKSISVVPIVNIMNICIAHEIVMLLQKNLTSPLTFQPSGLPRGRGHSEHHLRKPQSLH